MISRDNKKKSHKRSTKNRLSYTFHPYEIAFCGYSNSGKTTLVKRIIERMSVACSIGYIKHDAHQFEMDKKGKDTWQAWSRGANQVHISDPKHAASIRRGNLNQYENKSHFLNNDFVIVEGCKESNIPKIVVVDSGEKILRRTDNEELSSVVAFVGANEKSESWSSDQPYFHRDDIDSITSFLSDYLQSKVPPLYGLVLAGGRSTRMNSDKALLRYGEQPQSEVMCELLKRHTVKTFLSCRPGQRENQLPQFEQIHDSFYEFGPLGGILSAQRLHPEAAWLVVACDLPFLNEETVQQLVTNRASMRFATCFDSSINTLPEPLCAIYEPKFYRKSLEFVASGYECPRKILLNCPVQRLELENSEALENINYEDEFILARKKIEEITQKTGGASGIERS